MTRKHCLKHCKVQF